MKFDSASFRVHLTALLLACGIVAASGNSTAATVAGVEMPAPYPPCPVVDSYWGQRIEDPYRCLEETSAPAVQAYMKAQAAATAQVLAKLPGRDKLLQRIQEIDADVPANVSTVNRDSRGYLFYEKRLASDNQFKLVMRQGFDGPEKVLVDPETLAKATGKPHAIGGYSNSPDGHRVAYSVSGGGTEIGSLHVLDTQTGDEVMPPIDRIRGGGASWLPDSSGFFYSRLAPNWEQRPRAERFMDNTVYLRRLGEPGEDLAVFGPTVHPELKLDRSDSAHVLVMPDRPFGLAVVYHGVSRYRSLYISDKSALLAGKPVWRKLFDQSAQIAQVTGHQGWLYLRSAANAPRYQLMRLALPDTELSKAEVLVPNGQAVITGLGAAPEGLYFTQRDGGVHQLFRLPHGARPGTAAQPIQLPFEGAVAIADVDPTLSGAVLRLSGWTRAAKYFFLDADAKTPRPLDLTPPGKFDLLSGVTAREVKVKSHDGVEVPVSILARSDVKLDGRNPTILYGYAAYGTVEDPAISPRLLAWLEQGGIYVICHARGGGIYGDEWHKAGHKTTKFNSWRDGIATAEWLISQGYTSPTKLAVFGGSAGGIFAGRTITERPDLFAAAGIGVGNLDQIRSETRANGAGNIPEYGSVKVEAEFHALRNNSTYENIRPGTTYPAILFEHGVNDSRVDVWMSTKAATRFIAAQATDAVKAKPVLMRLEEDAGHGIGATRLQSQQRTADRWAFFLWQAGMEGFQPLK